MYEALALPTRGGHIGEDIAQLPSAGAIEPHRPKQGWVVSEAYR